MKTVVLLFSLLATCFAEADIFKRIVNGSPAQIYDNPHQVSLQLRFGNYAWFHSCGGVLIAPTKVLTAGHCVDNVDAINLRVQVGAHNMSEDNPYVQTVRVSAFTIHAEYDPYASGFPNDIAVITLAAPVILNENVQIAKLAEPGATFAGEACKITGWGWTADGKGALTLKEAKITKISNEKCQSIWGFSTISPKHICVFEEQAESGDRPSSCLGDSGGPLMCGEKFDTLAGVTSWGISTCSGDFPSVYTRVSEHRDFISENL